MKVLIYYCDDSPIDEREIPSITIVDKLYVKELKLIPKTYVFDINKKAELEILIIFLEFRNLLMDMAKLRVQ